MKKFIAIALIALQTANAEYYDHNNYDCNNYGNGYTDCRQTPCLSQDIFLGAIVVVGAVAAVVVANSGGNGSHKTVRNGHH